MAMIRSTLLLFLVASSFLLVQILASTNLETLDDEDPMNVTVDENPTDDGFEDFIDNGIGDSAVNDTLPSVLTCSADYPRMDPKRRKSFQNLTPRPHGVCVRADGFFVTASWLPNRKYVFLYDTCGWMVKQINLPARVLYSGGCVFTRNKLFYGDVDGRRILQFTSSGTYEKVFATGQKFLRFTVRKNLLYATMIPSKKVLAYNINTGNIAYRFETTTGYARGLAFDPTGYLHVSTWGKVVEMFTYKGFKVGQHLYPQLARADGLLIDSNHYSIITDRPHRQVLVFNHAGLLTKRITGFGNPLDVAMGYKCSYLLVADYSHNGVYLL